MRKAKAQTAIEYLTIFGWALLALLVVLSALYMSGILKFQSVLPRECAFQPGVECTDFRLIPTQTCGFVICDRIDLTLKNRFGFAIKAGIPTGVSSTGVASISCGVAIVPTKTEPDQSFTRAVCFLSGTMTAGAYQRYYVNITYVNCETASNPATCVGDGSSYVNLGYANSYVESP